MRKLQMRQKISYIAPIIVILLSLGFLGFFLISSPKERHRILIIQSYESTCLTSQALTAEIIKDFKEAGLIPEVRYFYLDCESYLNDPEIKHMSHLIDSVTADGWKPEVILVNDDQATYSLLMSGHKLTHSTPIVFAGVNFPNKSLLKKYPNVTGFKDSIDILTNLRFIKEFRKSAKGLY